MVPGHEGVGIVRQLGADVKSLKVGDRVGITWIRDSCGGCVPCGEGRENICTDGYQGTYLGPAAGCWGSSSPSHEFGGCFAKVQRINAKFAMKIPENLPAEMACPLMCGGGTVFEPLLDDAKPGSRVGVVGAGGLGTAAMRLAKIMGCRATAISRSAAKKEGCMADGAFGFLVSTDAEAMKAAAGSFDLIIDTAPVNSDVSQWLDLVKFDGVYCRVGIPSASDMEFKYNYIPLIFTQKKIVGSIVTGTARTRLMLDLAEANKDVFADKPEWHVDVMDFKDCNEAMDMLVANKNPGFRILLKW